MKNSIYVLITSVAILIVSAPFALGQSLTLTGWTQDIIAENSASSPAAGTNYSIVPPGGPGGGLPANLGWVFYETGAPNSTEGLPTNREITSLSNPEVTFQLQPYVGNNAVVNDGTLVLTNPGSFTSLSFLTSAQGNPSESFDATLNFSDGSAITLTGEDLDWANADLPDAAITDCGVVLDYNSWQGFYTAQLSMFEHDYVLPTADQGKVLDSINFSRTSGNYEMLFAVNGYSMPSTPEPGGIDLLTGICILSLGIITDRRRKCV